MSNGSRTSRGGSRLCGAAASLRHAALVVGLLGCAHGRGPAGASLPPTSTEGELAVLEVENNTTLDVRIFLLRAGMPTRLGTVTGMSTAMFELTPDMLGHDIRFSANPVAGSRRTITDMIAIRAGQLVSLHLDNMMRSYRLSVW